MSGATAFGDMKFCIIFFYFQMFKGGAIFHLTSEYCKLGKPHIF